jgi:predicted lipoprotein with Yx(FWY)xxD motif
MDKKPVYAQGLYFNVVKPETPEAVKKWKKGSISIQKEKFLAQLNELPADDKGYVRFDLTKNEKDGEVFYSFRLNDWKPLPVIQADTAEKKFNQIGRPDYDMEAAIKAEDIPF